MIPLGFEFFADLSGRSKSRHRQIDGNMFPLVCKHTHIKELATEDLSSMNGTVSHQRIEDSTRRWIFEDLKNEWSTETMFRPVSEHVSFTLTTPSRTKQQPVAASVPMGTLLWLSVYPCMISDPYWLDSVWHFPETPGVTSFMSFWVNRQGNCCLIRWSWVNPQEGEA